jgi:hypothetical protein
MMVETKALFGNVQMLVFDPAFHASFCILEIKVFERFRILAFETEHLILIFRTLLISVF